VTAAVPDADAPPAAAEFQGRCLCGGVRLRLRGPLPPVQICHCSQCRQAQGGPFATNLPVARAQLTLEDPHGLLQAYSASPGKERVFCRRCGSPVFSRRTALPDIVRVRAGLLASPAGLQLGFHQHVGSKADWWPLDDGLPQHPAWPPAGAPPEPVPEPPPGPPTGGS
jgi:hypothetical protein